MLYKIYASWNKMNDCCLIVMLKDFFYGNIYDYIFS